MKFPVPSVSLWAVGWRGPPNHTVYCHSSWLLMKWWDPTAKETTHCGCRAWRNQAGTEPEESFLWALVALEGAMWLFKEKSHGQSYPTVNFVSYNTNFLDKMCPLEWWWHDWCEANQHLYNWIWACSTGEYACWVQQSSQKFMAHRVIDPMGEPAIVLLLDRQVSSCLLNIYIIKSVIISAYIRKLTFSVGNG